MDSSSSAANLCQTHVTDHPEVDPDRRGESPAANKRQRGGGAKRHPVRSEASKHVELHLLLRARGEKLGF